MAKVKVSGEAGTKLTLTCDLLIRNLGGSPLKFLNTFRRWKNSSSAVKWYLIIIHMFVHRQANWIHYFVHSVASSTLSTVQKFVADRPKSFDWPVPEYGMFHYGNRVVAESVLSALAFARDWTRRWIDLEQYISMTAYSLIRLVL